MLAAGIFAIAFFLGLVASGVTPAVALLFGGAVLVLPFAKLPYGILGTGTPVEGEKTAEQLLKEIGDNLKTKTAEIQKAVAEKADRSEIDALREQITALKEQKQAAEIKALEDKIGEQLKTIIAQGEEITKIKELGQMEGGYRSIGDALAVALDAKKGEIAEMRAKGQHAPLRIEFKDAVTITDAATIGAGATQISLTSNTGIISQVRKREVRYLANVSVGRVGGDRAMWIEETDEQGAPTFIGEGGAKAQASVLYVEKTKAVKKVAVFCKMSMEFMADLPQFVSYVQNNLMRRLDIKVEDELFNGNDVGNNLAGLYQYDTAFAADAELANNVANANEFDVCEAIALQVEKAFGIANALFVHPSTLAKMKLIKDSTGRPVWKDYVTITGEMVISGMRLITTTAVTSGNFIGGDLNVANVLFREEMAFQLGLDGNDFTNNLKTALLEKRLVQFVSANDTPLIVSGDFTTAKAALELEVAP